MHIPIIPSNMRTLNITITKTKSKGGQRGLITFPLDLIQANNIKDGDKIVLVYLCKAGEKLPHSEIIN